MKSLPLVVFAIFPFIGFSQQKPLNYTSSIIAYNNKLVTRAVIITGDSNLLLQTPALETSFMNILLSGIKKEIIKAYSADNDTIMVTNQSITDLLQPETLHGSATFIPDSVEKFLIKEEWFFQQDKGRMVVRIKAIAPVIKVTNATGVISEAPAFWLHYADIRDFLATQKVKSDLKKKKPENLRDVMDGRYFSSTVISVSPKAL